MPKYDYRKTPAVREQLAIGASIAAALPQRMTQSEVAKQLGITQQAVSYAERQALFKLRAKLLELSRDRVC